MNQIPATPVIMYVDDDADDLMLIRETLISIEPLGDVRTYTDADVFFGNLEHLPAARIAYVIVLDLNMPKKGGMEILKELKQNERLQWIPVVVLTNSNHSAHREQAMSSGATLYLTKPYTSQEMLTVCSQIIACAKSADNYN